MALLDCSTLESAVESLGAILGIGPDQVRGRALACSIDFSHRTLPAEKQVLQHFGYADNDDVPEPMAIRWFHATRALPGTDFSDGLLPTDEVLPLLWSQLRAIAGQFGPPEEFDAYKRTFPTADRMFARQFRSKPSGGRQWAGPFAFLIREAALGRFSGHRRFTGVSETVEDICRDYGEVFPDRNLLAAYQAAAKPCVVVFTMPGNYPGAAGAALNYVCRSLLGLEQDLYCNENFSGEGRKVPGGWIDQVEWLE